MPKSPQSGTKWVWIRPLVLAPQMKKVKNSTQNVGTVAASLRTASGVVNSDIKGGCATGWAGAGGAVSP